MFSSPISNGRNSSPGNDFIDNSSPVPEPTMCDCQNQLAHHDWDGIPHKDLPELCKRSMAMGDDALTSEKNDGDANKDASATESDPEWDPKWEHVIIRRARRNQRKDLLKNAGGDTKGTDLKEAIVADKDEGEDPTCTKGRKHRRSDKENSGSWTCKTSKKGRDIRIRIRDLKKGSKVKVSVKIRT